MVKKTHYLSLKKEAFLLFEGLLSKIKNDFIKILFNLNVVVSLEKKKYKAKSKLLKKMNFKKLVEMKNVLVVQEKNLNIATATFRSIFF